MGFFSSGLGRGIAAVGTGGMSEAFRAAQPGGGSGGGGGGGTNYQAGQPDFQGRPLVNEYMSMMPQEGYNAYQGEALRQGPSAWAGMTNNMANLKEADARERGAGEVAGQTAQSRSQLAAQGGLTSGARERIAEGGAKNYMAMSQDLARQGLSNETQVGVQDEQNRMSNLGNFASMEGTKGQNAADYAMRQYEAKVKGWAANEQANATADAGKK